MYEDFCLQSFLAVVFMTYEQAAHGVIYQKSATCDVSFQAEQQVMQLTPWKLG